MLINSADIHSVRAGPIAQLIDYEGHGHAGPPAALRSADGASGWLLGAKADGKAPFLPNARPVHTSTLICWISSGARESRAGVVVMERLEGHSKGIHKVSPC